jgi:putative transposase
MISTPDRRRAVELIDETNGAGARLSVACAELEISERTYLRWRPPALPGGDGCVREDRRPTAERPAPSNKLTQVERDAIVETCNAREFASLPPSQIVPELADRGTYLASESSLYRVLRERGQNRRRGRSRPSAKRKAPTSFEATGPCQVWSWDITWLPGPIAGMFFYLYLIVDIYSRKVVGWEVHERESADLAAGVIERAAWAEKCPTGPLTLHADNGSPMKGATLRATLERLGVTASYSRPRVSNDNPFSEALFRTCKYVPEWPQRGFARLDDARAWVARFVAWYNNEHLHSAIRFVTPAARHRGEDRAVLARRAWVYEAAREMHPQRWSGETRCWRPIGSVWLNPDRSTEDVGPATRAHNAGGGGPTSGQPQKLTA